MRQIYNRDSSLGVGDSYSSIVKIMEVGEQDLKKYVYIDTWSEAELSNNDMNSDEIDVWLNMNVEELEYNFTILKIEEDVATQISIFVNTLDKLRIKPNIFESSIKEDPVDSEYKTISFYAKTYAESARYSMLEITITNDWINKSEFISGVIDSIEHKKRDKVIYSEDKPYEFFRIDGRDKHDFIHVPFDRIQK